MVGREQAFVKWVCPRSLEASEAAPAVLDLARSIREAFGEWALAFCDIPPDMVDGTGILELAGALKVGEITFWVGSSEQTDEFRQAVAAMWKGCFNTDMAVLVRDRPFSPADCEQVAGILRAAHRWDRLGWLLASTSSLSPVPRGAETELTRMASLVVLPFYDGMGLTLVRRGGREDMESAIIACARLIVAFGGSLTADPSGSI